jgi:hypothetical protein
MPHIAADRVKDTTTTTGTGSVTLSNSAPTGFRTFGSVCANNDTTLYAIVHQSAAEWEVGYGTYSTTEPALARTTVIASSNADAAVNFSAGTKDVFINSPAVVQPWGVLTVTDSTNQNNYNPTGLNFAQRLRWNGTASIKITGLQGGYEGRQITLHNDSTDYLLWVENENTGSSAANRFVLPGKFPIFLMPGDRATFVYDAIDSRWEYAYGSQPGPMGLQFFTDFLGGTGTANLSTNGQLTNFVSGTSAAAAIST